MLCFKMYSYLTKTLQLVKELLLLWSPVCHNNLKYGDHLREHPCERKYSVPTGKFSNRHIKILFTFDKSLMPNATFGDIVTFTRSPVCQ